MRLPDKYQVCIGNKYVTIDLKQVFNFNSVDK